MHTQHKVAVLVALIRSTSTFAFTRPGTTFATINQSMSLTESHADTANVAASLLNEAGHHNNETNEGMIFGRFQIDASQIFYRSASGLTAGIVNLRPIVSGHVMLVPTRVVPLLSDLTEEEYLDLWGSVRTVQAMLGRHYNCPGFNVAVQDGPAAGQSVPHVHVHVLPRREGDFERNDDVYDELEAWAPRENSACKQGRLDVPEDDERRDRTMEEMNAESMIYKSLLAKSKE